MSPLEHLLAMALLIAASVVGAVSSGCATRVRVQGDAWFCVNGDAAAVCAGLQHGACPRKGTSAVDACASGLASFQQGTGVCVAPQDAQCVQRAPSHDWSCVFPASVNVTTVSATSLSALRGATTTTTTPPPTRESINSTVLNSIVGGAVAAIGILSIVLVRRRRYSPPVAPPPPSVTPLYFRESSYVRL